MSSPIQHRLYLILWVLSKFTINAVSKSSIISQILSKESCEFGPCHWDSLRATFMQVPMLYYYSMEEWGSKWDTIRPAGLNDLKIILTLLAKAIAIYIQITIIEVGESSLKGLFMKTRFVILFQQLNGSCISFEKLLTQLIGRTWG